MAKYLVCGHLTLDDTVFPDGRTAMGNLGGNCLYSAIGAGVWTDDVMMVSRLGEGYPPESLMRIRGAGLRTAGLSRSPHHCIRQWQLYDVDGGRTYVRLASAGSYADLAPSPGDVDESLVPDTRGCHVAPMQIELQGAWVEWARGRGCMVTVSPRRPSGYREIFMSIQVLGPGAQRGRTGSLATGHQPP